MLTLTGPPAATRVRRNLRSEIAIVIAFVLIALAAPLLACAISILGIAALSKRPAVIGFTTVAVVSALFAWVNAGKGIVNDWSWYVQHYQALEYTPLSEYLGHPLGPVTPKVTEPVYYFFARVLSTTTGANIEALAVGVTLVIYCLMGTAIALSVVSEASKPWTVAVATVAGLFIGLTFTLSTQLVRQEIAAALIGLAIVNSAKRKWLLTAVLLTTATLTHNAALIPAAALILAIILRGRRRGRALWMALSGILFCALGHLWISVTSDESYFIKDDGSVSLAVIALDVGILLAFAFLIRKRGLGDNPIAATILLCVPSFYGFILGVASQPIPLLRMYFFIEVLRALMVAFICVFLMRDRWRIMTGTVIVAAAISYLMMRVQKSPFVYDNSLLDILLWSPLGR